MEDTRKFRKYQVAIHNFFMNHVGEDVGLEGPPGMGKTSNIIGATAQFIRDELYQKVLIATTQEQIENRFVNREFRRLKIGRRILDVPDDLIVSARGGASVRLRISEFFKDPGQHALACTHAALSIMNTRRLPRDLSGHVLFVDEGHHAPADGLSKFVAAWRQRGGVVIYVTATSYRSDGRKVGPEADAWFIRPLALHMEEGFAPAEFKSEIRAVNGRNVKVSYGQMTGKAEPPKAYIKDIVKTMMEAWEEIGRPKVIVRVPPLIGGSGWLVRAIVRGFRRNGARTVDATGPNIQRKKDFLKVLDAEARRKYRSSKVDVIVGIQRVTEGTDWKHCEAVFCVGLPGSMTFIVQLTGRAMRMKDDSCPKRRRDVARALFFVPTTGKELTEQLSTDHSRAVLLQTCFMADSQSGQQWLLQKEFEKIGCAPKVADQEERAKIIIIIARLKGEAAKKDVKLTAGECVRRVLRDHPQFDRGLVKQVVTECILKSSAGEKLKRRIRSIGRSRSPLGLRPWIVEILDEVLPEFQDATLDGNDSASILAKQAHILTGGNLTKWSNRLVEAILSKDLIRELVQEHVGD